MTEHAGPVHLARALAAVVAAALLAPGCGKSEPLPYSGFVDAPVAAVAAQTSGQIASLPVREGDHVKKGQLLAQIDSSERQASVSIAEANVQRAKQGLKQAKANLRAASPAVRGARAGIKRAQATLDEAQKSYDRTEKLVESGAGTPADLDSARARLLEARAAVESTTAAKAESQGKLGATFAAVDTAEADVQSAKAQLAMAEVQLKQTRVLCPFDGIVVSRNLEAGEWATPGVPVVTVEDTAHPWVRLDVEETRFRSLSIGQRAEIRVIALGERRFAGHVTQIGAEGDFALNRDVKRGRPDIRTFLVRVAFDKPPPELRPGMTSEVRLVGGAPALPAKSSQAKR